MSAYPYPAGHRGVETSIEAARAIASRLGQLQRMTHAAIVQAGLGGLTAHEAAAALNADKAAIQPRLSELRSLGSIVDSGRRRKNASGRSAIVWIAATR